MKPLRQTAVLALIIAASLLCAVGCAKKEEPAPSQGSVYYDGPMQPKTQDAPSKQ